jgi:outer membrane protein OmpA-like peptidoglycan-associated protein
MKDSVFNIGDYIKCPIILFDLDKSSFHHSLNVMDSIKVIARFLKKNKNLVIEIGQHTDYRGNNPNLSSHLSLGRAKIIVDSLIALGIAAERLTPAGYQGVKPLVLNEDVTLPSGKIVPKGTYLSQLWIDKNFPQEKNKDAYEFIMLLNRRTELKVLRTDYKAKN